MFGLPSAELEKSPPFPCCTALRRSPKPVPNCPPGTSTVWVEYTSGSFPVSPYAARNFPKLKRPFWSVFPSALVKVQATLALGYHARGLLSPKVEKPSLRNAPVRYSWLNLSLIHISEPTRRTPISYA